MASMDGMEEVIVPDAHPPLGLGGDPVMDDYAGNRRRVPHQPFGWFVAMTVYFGYAVLIAFGKLRDVCGRLSGRSRYFGGKFTKKGYSPLLKDWEDFYTRRLYHRIQDCWNRPIVGAPAASCTRVVERVTLDNNKSMVMTNKYRGCLNLGSYNYLGFADDWHTACKDSVLDAVDNFHPSMCSGRLDGGGTVLHNELEAVVAKFVGKPAAIVFNMGYLTNASAIPAIMGKGTLIVSDANNHTSIVNGARASGAAIRVFKHNDARNLEAVLRDAIADGQPRTHRPWKKILVMVEGIYSMEGSICNLAEIVRVAKAHKCYVYLDEAHSIGCLGETGRGICEHLGVDTADVDIMMGTFTKSFGAMGGYIASSQEFIDYLRANTGNSLYANAMSPVVCKQTLRAFEVLTGEDGTDTGARKLLALRNNANYFRRRLMDMGTSVVGDWDSPVVPMMLYNPTKIAAFSVECMKRGLAVVVVGFPATSLIESRARFCLSAGHTKEQLDYALDRIEEVCKLLKLRYNHSMFG